MKLNDKKNSINIFREIRDLTVLGFALNENEICKLVNKSKKIHLDV